MGAVDLFAVASALIGALVIAWFRAEIAACYDPLINWLIARAASAMPSLERAEAEAEMHSLVSAIRSPTWRLINACSLVWSAKEAASETCTPRIRYITAEDKKEAKRLGWLLSGVEAVLHTSCGAMVGTYLASGANATWMALASVYAISLWGQWRARAAERRLIERIIEFSATYEQHLRKLENTDPTNDNQ